MRSHLLFIFSLFSFAAVGQIYNPVKWAFDLKPSGNGEYVFTAKATIEAGWWVYSQHLDNEDGPIATTVFFDAGSHFKLIGKNKESANAKKIFDKIFEMNVTKFQHYYTIEQKIKFNDPSKTITGIVNYMTCNDDRCLPPTDVEFELKATAGSSGDANPKSGLPDTKSITQGDKLTTEEKNISVEKKKITEESVPSIPSSSQTKFTIKPGSAVSQILAPVKWTFRSEFKSENTYEIIAEASIDDGWHIYATVKQQEAGPITTTLIIKENPSFVLEGNTIEQSSSRVAEHDKFFDVDVLKFKHDARLTQLIKSANPIIVSGSIEFQTCDDTRCLPPEYIEFEVDLKTGSQIVENLTAAKPMADEKGVIDQSIAILQSTYENPLSDCGHVEDKKQNFWLMFLLGIGGGLIALLTPCVFPMIPLTVSFFSKDRKRKGWQNGLWYGASIILIYVTLGILITLIFGATALNNLSTNAVANTLFFVIFVFFAFSFFGFYEITLPSSWGNRSDAMADKGGLIGIFFMATTLAIVSFSCTGPIIGASLVTAIAEGILGPTIVMLGFSIALAIPFGLFAAFPSWLNSLPKSGGWMNTVKVMLGFVELALALKFLSVADMASHWGFLRYELFIGLWVLISFAMAVYMFGLIRFPHDSPKSKITTIPGLVGLFFVGLGIYLATGFFHSEKTGTYNALSIMSGLAPPAHYNFLIPKKDIDADLTAQYSSLTKCANNFNCFHDYYEGLAYARQMNKPILLDFTGYGCVNCRKTEEHIWVNENVRRKINDDFVLVSLYVDDKELLDTMLYSAIQNKKIRSVGGIWADFQITNFKQNSQPLYVLLTPDQQVLTAPRSYDPDADAYNAFLECGLNAFKDRNAPVLGSAQ